MTARNNSRMHLPFFCKSLSECEYTFGITITVLKISQNNDNRGRHLEFYSHTGIGNWFQCFPVYPGLNLSSISVSGSRSGFRLFHTPIWAPLILLIVLELSPLLSKMSGKKWVHQVYYSDTFGHKKCIFVNITDIYKVYHYLSHSIKS